MHRSGIPYWPQDQRYSRPRRFVSQQIEALESRELLTSPGSAPTDIVLSNNSVAENQWAGTVVGTLSATDSDVGDTFTFALVSGAGSTDNASFSITGNTLKTAASFDYETQSSDSIRVQVTDQNGLTFEKQLTVNVTNTSDSLPTGTSLVGATTWETIFLDKYPYDFTGFDDVAGTGNTTGPSVHSKPSLSANGRYVAFESSVSNLVSGDSNRSSDIFVRDLLTGTTTRASVSNSGVEGNGGSYGASISADGRFVTFYSAASNLIENDTNARSDIFVRDLLAGTTTLVSANSAGIQGDSSSYGPAISEDGRFIAFESYSDNLIPNGTDGKLNIFMRDLQSGTTSLVSANNDGSAGNDYSTYPSISTDGRYVAFYSYATNLVSSDYNGALDVFVRDTQSGTTTRVSVDNSGSEVHSQSYEPAISANGRYVAFYSSSSELVPGDSNGGLDVFVRDLQLDTTTRVSVDSSGNEANYGSFAPAISADGRYVTFFSYADNLIPGGTNRERQVFVRDLLTGTTTLESVDSNGIEGDGVSFLPTISADGQYIAFFSDSSNLVPDDTNGTYDLFVRNLGHTAPANITLSNSTVAENQAVGTIVGTLSPVGAATGSRLTYSFVAGSGDDGNSLFAIVGNTLETAAIFNYEMQTHYSIRLRGTDPSGNVFEESMVVVVTNVNETPTSISLSTTSVFENAPQGTAVGNLSAQDPDADSTFTFSLVPGAGSTDNHLFQISDDINDYSNHSKQLVTTESFDYETKKSYSVRIRVTDRGGLSFDKVIMINVLDLDETKHLISVGEGVAANDSADGIGYLLFSAPNVKTRFGGLNSSVAPNFLAVQYNNGQWQYANNDVWVNFTPLASDRLVARLDYTNDTVVMLKNQFSVTNGVQQGYLDTDLIVTPNVFGGKPNLGEFALSGTFLLFPTASRIETATWSSPLGSGVAANDSATGVGYMMYSQQELDQRFANFTYGSALNFVAVQYNGTQWRYANNDTWVNFSPVASDRLVAQLDYTNDTATLLKGQFSKIQGIDQGYLDGDITITPNVYGGVANKGEFGMTGTYLVFIPSGTGTSANWAPTQLTLSKSAVAENQPIGTVVGTLSANDPEGSTLSYWFVSGTGSSDKSSFQIVGNQLQTKALFNYEAKSSYSVRVRVTDKGGLSYEKAFTITIADVFDSPFGDVRSGVTANDAATGVGYLMYSQQSVQSRFTGAISGGQADHFVAVQFIGGHWKYANNDVWVNFNPNGLDRLVAQLDYTNDTVTLLKGLYGVVNGIQQGYVDSNLTITPNLFAGVANPGEFTVAGTFIEFPPPVSVGNLRSGVAGNDGATGIGYMLFSTQNLKTRFPGLTATNADQFISVQFRNGGWFYANNDTWVSFTPVSTDRLIAQLDFTNDTVTMLRGVSGSLNGIRRGYLDTNLVITPNLFGGAKNTGEFGLSGTQMILEP